MIRSPTLSNLNFFLISYCMYSYWNVTTNDDKYTYYRDFVGAVANAAVHNLETLTVFEEDETLEDVDFKRIAVAVHPNATHAITSFDDDYRVEHRFVFTELGLCDIINAPIAVLLSEEYWRNLLYTEIVLKLLNIH